MKLEGGCWEVEGEALECAYPEPGPEPCRLAREEELPRSARSMRARAEDAGWTVEATYARGHRPDGRARSAGRVVGSLALRMRHPDGVRAVAIWWDGAWESGFTLMTSGLRCAGFREVLAVLTGSRATQGVARQERRGSRDEDQQEYHAG